MAKNKKRKTNKGNRIVKRVNGKIDAFAQAMLFETQKRRFAQLGAEKMDAIALAGVGMDFGVAVEAGNFIKPELVSDIVVDGDKLKFTLDHGVNADDSKLCLDYETSSGNTSDIVNYTISKNKLNGELKISSKLINAIYSMPISASAEFLQWEFELPQSVYEAMVEFNK